MEEKLCWSNLWLLGGGGLGGGGLHRGRAHRVPDRGLCRRGVGGNYPWDFTV